MLPAPRFHHLHLNSVDPDAAIAFYLWQFPSTSRTRWAGIPALASPNDVLILFDRVNRPPAIAPQAAIWHFGWHVTDIRRNRETYLTRAEVELLPLYTGEGSDFVLINTDTWPGRDGVLGLTRAQIAEAKAAGMQPTRNGGFAYMRQGGAPLVPSRGHLYDHVALGVGDLDAWIAKLTAEGVTFLEPLNRLGDIRAVMIEGPSREVIELVETR